MEKLKKLVANKKIFYGLIALFGAMVATPIFAAPTSTPADVMSDVVDSGLTSAINLVKLVMTQYFPYIIAIIASIALLKWVFKLAKIGSHH